MASNLKVSVDWNRDGTFVGPFDDVTSSVRGGSAGQVTVEAGRDLTDVMPQIITSRGSLTLDNRTRRYTRRNTASPLSGLLLPARPVSVTRVVGGVGGTGGTTQAIYRGRTDDHEGEPDPDRQAVTLGLVDVLQDMRGRKVSTSVGVKTGIRVGDALNFLLNDIGWTAGRDIDPGVSLLPVWWEEGNDVFDSIGRLLSSEGPPAFVAIDASGAFVFRDRHHRILKATSATSQGTWHAGGKVEPVLGAGFRARDSWSTIVNSVQGSLPVYQILGVQPVWSDDGPYFAPPSPATNVIIAQADSIFVNVVGVRFNSGVGSPITVSVSAGIGPTVFITLRGGAIGNTASNLQLMAQPVVQTSTASYSSSDGTSQTAYGVRSLPGTDSIGPWCTPGDAQAIADQVVQDRKNPLTQVTAQFAVGRTAGGNAAGSIARANAVLARQLSHRVTLDVPREGLVAEDYFVESITHELAGEDDHVVTMTAEQAPTASPSGSTIFRFDTAGQGFNQGVFGR